MLRLSPCCRLAGPGLPGWALCCSSVALLLQQLGPPFRCTNRANTCAIGSAAVLLWQGQPNLFSWYPAVALI